MNLKQGLGFAGIAALFLGVFSPIISLPLFGNMNYFQNGKGDGIFILGFACISILLILFKRFNWLWVTGSGCLGIMGFTIIAFQSKMNEAKAQLELQLAGNPFRGVADAVMQSVQLQWGWAILILGVILLFVSASIKEPS